MIFSIPRTACSLAGLLLLIPAAFAPQQRTSPSRLDVDGTVSKVRIEVDLTFRFVAPLHVHGGSST